MTRDAVKRAIRTGVMQAIDAAQTKRVPHELIEKQINYADALIMNVVEAYVEEEIEKAWTARKGAAV